MAQPADDPSRAEARKIGYAGVEAYQAGDFATAHDRLETAFQMLRVPSLGLWSARALAKLGKLVEAEARYLEVIRLPTSVGDEAIQEQARQDARNERAELARRIPSVLVRIEGAPAAEVAVTIDGAPLTGSAVGESHLVNPGRHRIEGVRATARASAEVVAAEGEQKEAVLRFAAATADASGTPAGDATLTAPRADGASATATKRTAGWAMVVAGGAGICRRRRDRPGGDLEEGRARRRGLRQRRLPPRPARRGRQLRADATRLRRRPDSGRGARGRRDVPAADHAVERAVPAANTRPWRGGRARRSTNIRFAIVPGGTMLRGEF